MTITWTRRARERWDSGPDLELCRLGFDADLANCKRIWLRFWDIEVSCGSCRGALFQTRSWIVDQVTTCDAHPQCCTSILDDDETSP